MLVDDKIYLVTSTRPEYLALKYANRHGLTTGATGTGKTASLQIIAGPESGPVRGILGSLTHGR